MRNDVLLPRGNLATRDKASSRLHHVHLKPSEAIKGRFSDKI